MVFKREKRRIDSQMAKTSKNTSLFAMLFSDLMMGAMAVIIVLLVFLQVVNIRGSGEFEAQDELDFPLGLDMNEFPIVRIRIEYCSLDTISQNKTKFKWDGDIETVTQYVMGYTENGTYCEYRLAHFSQGLGGKIVEISSSSGSNEQAVTINVLVTVAGYAKQKRNFINYDRYGSLIATVDLNSEEVIYGR